MPSALLSQIERSLDQLTHKERLRLMEQLAHHLLAETTDNSDNEKNSFTGQLERMAADPQIIAEVKKIHREFILTDSDGLEC